MELLLKQSFYFNSQYFILKTDKKIKLIFATGGLVIARTMWKKIDLETVTVFL